MLLHNPDLLKAGEMNFHHVETIIACLYQEACDLLQQRLAVKAKPGKEKASKGSKANSALDAEQVELWIKQTFRLLDTKSMADVGRTAKQESRSLTWRVSSRM